MAVPFSSTYTVSAGLPIYAGKYSGGAFVGAVVLDDASPSAALASNLSQMSGGVTLDGLTPLGSYKPDPGNARISIWGQSNAIGRANQSDLSAPPLSTEDPGLATLMSSTFSRVYIWDGFTTFAQLTSSNNYSAASQFGPEFGIAVRWMRETSSGNLYIDKSNAFSGVSITYDAFVHGGYNYTNWFAHLANQNTWLSSNGVTLKHDDWIWLQGEADQGMAQATYQSDLTTLIASLTSDGYLTAASKRILALMAPGSAQYDANVSAAKVAVAAASPSNTSTYQMLLQMNSDNLHQNGQGQVNAGYAFFAALYGGSIITV